MLTSISVKTLFKLFGFFFSIWQPLGLQTLAVSPLEVSGKVRAEVGSVDIALVEAAGR